MGWLSNPFQRTDAPDHMVVGRKARFKHIQQTMMVSILMAAAFFHLTPFMAYVLKYDAGLNRQTFGRLLEYLRMSFSNDILVPHQYFLADANALPFKFGVLPGHEGAHLKAMAAYIIMAMVGAILGSLRHLTNPHKKMVMKADARWCTDEDLRSMEGMNQVGIRGGFLGALGKWPKGLRKNQMVRMIEPLSLLCLAPPGTGKTAGVVVPTILSCDDITIIVNDPKPELYLMTGGYREQKSYIFMMNWSKVDEPDKGVFYPRFNFLSPRLVPPPGPDRDTYLDSVAKTLIAEKTGGGDTYFIDKGRAALTGFMHYLVVRINEARDYKGVPTPWVGKEASLPMLVSWMAEAQFKAAQDVSDEDWDPEFLGPEEERAPPPEKDPNRDVMKEFIQELADAVNPAKDGPGRSTRAFMELSPLISMADKERSGVLGTMDQALIPFKNEAVQQRTSACDFTPDDMRGILDPAITARTELKPVGRDGKPVSGWRGPKDGEPHPDWLPVKKTGNAQAWERTRLKKDDPRWLDPVDVERGDVEAPLVQKGLDAYQKLFKDKANWRPCTLYVCINQADAKAFSTITALLFETMSLSLLSTGPKEYNGKTDRVVGPFPVLMLLDEFAKMPKIDAVIEGPDLGRSKKISYYLIAQSDGQIEKIYGKENSSIVYATTAVKLVFAQNDNDTIQKIVNMVGKTTMRRSSSSDEQGLHVQHLWKQNLSDQHEETDFLRSGDVSGMPVGTHILLVQRFNNKPMRLKTPLWYMDPVMKHLGYNDRAGTGPQATAFVPAHISAARTREHKRAMAEIVANKLQILTEAEGLTDYDEDELPDYDE